MRTSLLIAVLFLAACSDDMMSADSGPMRDAEIVNGCPVLDSPQASPGDPIDGDTFDSFASGFFATYCTRCHSTTLTGAIDRNGAPDGRDWDDEASVHMYLPLIRQWVGEVNGMPIGDPQPSCDERRRLVRWIDADAP